MGLAPTAARLAAAAGVGERPWRLWGLFEPVAAAMVSSVAVEGNLPPYWAQMASGAAASWVGSLAGWLSSWAMGMHLLRQSAQEHTQQQFGSQFGGDIRPEGQNVVHQHRGPLCTERRKVKKVIDLLLLSAAISPAEALFELLVRQSWARVFKIMSRLAPVCLFQTVSRLALSHIFQQKKFASLAFRVIALVKLRCTVFASVIFAAVIFAPVIFAPVLL